MVPSLTARTARASVVTKQYRSSHRLLGSRPRLRLAAANVDSGVAGPRLVLLDEPAAVEHTTGATDVVLFFCYHLCSSRSPHAVSDGRPKILIERRVVGTHQWPPRQSMRTRVHIRERAPRLADPRRRMTTKPEARRTLRSPYRTTRAPMDHDATRGTV